MINNKRKINKLVENEIKNIMESSLSRIWQFVEDDNRSFAVISAQRGELPDKENMQRHQDLQNKVRDLGYGYIEFKGGYKEDTGFTEEKSLFIPEISRKEAIDLGEKYDQESILYKQDGEFFGMIDTRDSPDSVIDEFKKSSGRENISMDDEIIQQFFSALAKGSHAGKKFVFQMKERLDTMKAYKKYLNEEEIKTDWKLLYINNFS